MIVTIVFGGIFVFERLKNRSEACRTKKNENIGREVGFLGINPLFSHFSDAFIHRFTLQAVIFKLTVMVTRVMRRTRSSPSPFTRFSSDMVASIPDLTLYISHHSLFFCSAFSRSFSTSAGSISMW